MTFAANRPWTRLTPLLGVLALLLSLSACDFQELNQNPNQPTEPTLPFLLTQAQTDFALAHDDDFYQGRFKSPYAQYFSLTQYTSESRYQYPLGRGGSVNGEWEDYYLLLNDLQEIIRRNRGVDAAEATQYGPNANQIAIAKIMQAYTFQTITDIWGPAPFDSSLAGQSNVAPPYASQEKIYTSLLDSLNSAIGSITDEPTLATGDVIFGGDMSRWKAFANSLKMRLAIRMSYAAPEAAQTALEEALSATTIDELDGSVVANAVRIPFRSAPQDYWDPIYQNFTNREDFAVSSTLLDRAMNPVQDPRRDAYAQLSNEGDFEGFPYGLQRSAALQVWNGGGGDYSKLSQRVAGQPDDFAFLMLPDEVLFMKAEAAERFDLGSQTASSYYQDAVASSLRYWGVTDQAAIDAYLSRVPYDNSTDWAPAPQGGNATWEQTLGIQKWIAFYMQGLQGWSVFRRLDFNGILVSPPGCPGNSTFNKPFPVRMQYPSSEEAINPNIDSALEMLGGDNTQAPRLWWDTEAQAAPALGRCSG